MVVDKAIAAARTGEIGDGKIFIEQVIRFVPGKRIWKRYKDLTELKSKL